MLVILPRITKGISLTERGLSRDFSPRGHGTPLVTRSAIDAINGLIKRVDLQREEIEMLTLVGERTAKKMRVALTEETMTVADAPVGLLFSEDSGEVIVKTEYQDKDCCECYIVSSGERFCSGDATRVKAMVLI